MNDFVLSAPVLFIAAHAADILSWAAIIFALALYIIMRPGVKMGRLMRWLLLGTFSASLVLTILLTIAQYSAFMSSEFGRMLLPPTQSWSYFIEYVLIRYWLPFGLTILLAAAWYGFMRLIKARSERYLAVGELELTTVVLVAVGWPHILILLPLAALCLLLVSMIKLVIFRIQLTTLGLPFLLAALATLLFASEIQKLFGY